MITEECLSRNLPPTPGAVGAPGTAAWESRGEGREGRGSTMWGEREGWWEGGHLLVLGGGMHKQHSVK